MLNLMNFINSWGATKSEQKMPMPNDQEISKNGILSTHAITINASPEEIWPWLVQIGQGRGGFYSYSWLENLVGCEMQNTDEILPQFQNLKLGDKVSIHPKAPPLTVKYLEENKCLALETWYLVLKPITKNKTRLITRAYGWVDPKQDSGVVAKTFGGSFFDIAHFIMEQKMLRKIKELSEAAALKNRKVYA